MRSSSTTSGNEPPFAQPGANVRIVLLGQPAIFVDGAFVKFRGLPKSLPILASLAIGRAAAISRESLAFAHWPDDDEETALGKLRRHLHDLTRSLPPPPRADEPWLTVERDTVRWNDAAGAALDIAEFVRFGEERKLSDAVACYRGDLLEGIYDDWCVFERERLRGLFLRHLVDLIAERSNERDFAAAATYARRLLAHEPWREDVVRDLMRCRYESGDRAGALHDFDTFATRLRNELATEPMPDTVALRDAIRRNAIVTLVESNVVDGADVSARATVLNMAGRRSEFAHLQHAWARAARGGGRVVFVRGERGIGKSRLAQAIVDVARLQGGRVLVGASSDPESLPYLPFIDALDGAAAFLPLGDPDVFRRAPSTVDDATQRARFFEAVATQFREIARARPVILVLEDLHWAGDATLALLAYIARRLARSPMLIVATVRDEDRPASAAFEAISTTLVADGRASVLRLGRLDRVAVAEAIEACVEGDVSEIARALHARTGGHPLFLTEAVRDRSFTTEAIVPAGLLELVARRWAEIDDDARIVAEIGAVGGTAFDVDLLARSTGWSSDRIIDATQSLIARSILVEDAGRGGIGYAFAHDIFRSTIYDTIPTDRREQRHGTLASVLQHRNEANVEAALIAHHYERANCHARAGRWYGVAAVHARGVHAHDEALAFAARAIETSDDHAVVVEALGLREELLDRLGRRNEQRAAIEALEAIVDGSPAHVAFDVALRRIRFHRSCGEIAQTNDLLERWRARAADAPPYFAAAVTLEDAISAFHSGEFAQSVERFTVALDGFIAVGDTTGEVTALCGIIRACASTGEIARAADSVATAIARAEGSGDGSLVVKALQAAINTLIFSQEWSSALVLAERALAVSRSVGDAMSEASVHERLATILSRRNEIVAATEHFDAALALYREGASPHGIASVLVNRAVLLTRVCDFEAARISIEEAEMLFRHLEIRPGIAIALINRGMIAFFREAYAEAKVLFGAGLAEAMSLGAPALEASARVNLGAALLELGDPRAAIAEMRQGFELSAGRRPVDEITDRADLALAYEAAGDLSAAESEIGSAIAALDTPEAHAVPHPHFIWFTGARIFRQNDPSRGTELLQRAQRVQQTQRAMLVSDHTRATFDTLRINRQIAAAIEHDRWPATSPNAREATEADCF